MFPQEKDFFVDVPRYRTFTPDFRYKRLEICKYAHNQGNNLEKCPDTFTIHISFGIGGAAHKMYCAYTIGLLSSPLYIQAEDTAHDKNWGSFLKLGNKCFA